jgi:hypothetical protein
MKKYTILIGLILLTCIPISIWLIYKHYQNYYKDGFNKNQSTKEIYGFEYNSERRKLGIKEIPEDWFTRNTTKKVHNLGTTTTSYDNSWTHQTWSNFDYTIDNPIYSKKIVNRYNGKLHYEEDHFEYLEESTYYLLRIKYKYFLAATNLDPWNYNFTTIMNDTIITEIELSLNQVDSLLNIWNIEK